MAAHTQLRGKVFIHHLQIGAIGELQVGLDWIGGRNGRIRGEKELVEAVGASDKEIGVPVGVTQGIAGADGFGDDVGDAIATHGREELAGLRQARSRQAQGHRTHENGRQRRMEWQAKSAGHPKTRPNITHPSLASFPHRVRRADRRFVRVLFPYPCATPASDLRPSVRSPAGDVRLVRAWAAFWASCWVGHWRAAKGYHGKPLRPRPNPVMGWCGEPNGLFDGVIRVTAEGNTQPVLMEINAICSLPNEPGWPSYDNLYGRILSRAEEAEGRSGNTQWQVLYNFSGTQDVRMGQKPGPWTDRLRNNLCRREDFDDRPKK
jgi:hypothetical protein